MRAKFARILMEGDKQNGKELHLKLAANMAVSSEEAPWGEEITASARKVLLDLVARHRGRSLSSSEVHTYLQVSPGQPFLLNLCRGVATATRDQDIPIWDHLEEGVHTGCIPGRPILDSGIFPREHRTGKDPDTYHHSPPRFDECEGNWRSAELVPEVTKSLVNKEVGKGWVHIWEGIRAEGRGRFSPIVDRLQVASCGNPSWSSCWRPGCSCRRSVGSC